MCFTEDAAGLEAGVEVRPLPTLPEEWKGWWYKACLFSPRAGLQGHILYLDLEPRSLLCVQFLLSNLEIQQKEQADYDHAETESKDDAAPERAGASPAPKRVLEVGARVRLRDGRVGVVVKKPRHRNRKWSFRLVTGDTVVQKKSVGGRASEGMLADGPVCVSFIRLRFVRWLDARN